MIQAVIFDFNGVLVDDEHVHFELFRDVLNENGIDLSEERYYDDYLGYDDRGCFEAALTDAGQRFGPDQIEALIARKAERYATVAANGLKFFPSASECVTILASRYPLAICSGALRPEIEFALERLRIRDAIGSITSAEDTNRCKPDPEGYLLALAALQARLGPGLQSQACLVIEDSLPGIEAAKAAGMRVVGVSHTYPIEAMRAANPDQIVANLREIEPAWIDRNFL